MKDVYSNCPAYENDRYILRLVQIEDAQDLVKVYSDKKAVPLFNSDNCGGDDFYYTTESRMKEAINYWLFEYNRRGFVRWSVISKEANEAIGTIELFHRDADDYFTNCGLLRLDLRSDYEQTEAIINILQLIIEPSYSLFNCDKIASKIPQAADERIRAFTRLGFHHTDEELIGHDGTKYNSYFVKKKTFN